MSIAQHARLLTVCQPDPFAMAARMKADAREEADKVAAAMVAPYGRMTEHADAAYAELMAGFDAALARKVS